MQNKNMTHSTTRSRSEVLFSLFSFLFIIFLVLSIVSCDSGDDEPKPDTENPNDSLINLDPIILAQNQMLVGTDTIKLTNVGFGSGQVRGTVSTNILDLGQIILFFGNADTGNGLNEPPAGTYTLIDSPTGLVSASGEVSMRITLASDVFNFYASGNSSGKVEITVDGDGYVSYAFSNVVLISTTASTPNLIVSANLGGNPNAALANTIQPTLGSYVLADNLFSSSQSASYNTAGGGERNDFTFLGLTIYFKSFTGIPNGTYDVVDGGLYGTFSSSFITNEKTCQMTIRETYIDGGNDFGSYFAVKNGGKVKVSTVDGKIVFEFENVIMAHSTTSPLFPLSGKFQY